jgi:isochorismate synthase
MSRQSTIPASGSRLVGDNSELARSIELVESALSLLGTAARPRTLSITVSAPVAALTTFLRAMPEEGSFVWCPPTGARFAGSGAAHELRMSGAGRFEALEQSVRALWKQVGTIATPGVEIHVPRVFGGFSFTHDDVSAAWSELGHGLFTLPRWLYVLDGDSARLVLTVRNDEVSNARAQRELVSELEGVLDLLGDSRFGVDPSPWVTIPEAAVEQTPFEEWNAHVEHIRSAIARGEFHKIVAARSCRVALNDDFDVLHAIERLAAESTSTRFAFRRATCTFLGASPEVLFSKTGRALSTHALAGTLPRSASGSQMLPSALLTSAKDLAEHAWVVRHLETSLAPLVEDGVCAVSTTAKLRQVRDLVHLETPIDAVLRSDVGVGQLLEVLHPTPAVGGFPMREAAAWIAENEDHRGWYAGGVGWIDASGDSCINVAIRSCLVGEGEALVYTGAGIVDASDATKEYEETAIKQGPMMRTLNVEPKRAARGRHGQDLAPAASAISATESDARDSVFRSGAHLIDPSMRRLANA